MTLSRTTGRLVSSRPRRSAGLIGRWSRKYGDRWLVILGVSTLAIGLIGTSLTPRIPVPWYSQSRVMQSLAGQSAIPVPTQNIKVSLPDEASKGWGGIAWLLILVIFAIAL